MSIVSYPLPAQEKQLSFTQLDVLTLDGSPLTNPTAGGINSGQFSEIDLDLDGVLDLVVFDRTSNKLSTYRFVDGAYEYAPRYEYQFPNQLINWVLLRDYNCDGLPDLFTSTSLGIKVYENTSTDSLSWTLAADPVITMGNSALNLFVNSTDLPAIVDIDNDDDLDILVFNFATGGFVEFHENRSMDLYGTCDSLEYVRVTREWGDFQECVCGTFAFDGEVCDGSNRTLHASGKALTVEDINEDGLPDVFFGEEACGDLFALPNEGTLETALFRQSQVPFPELTDQLTFPAAYFIDIDHDGQKDLVLSPNDRGNELDFHDFKSSVYAYENELGQFVDLEEQFLQSGMIDVGERSVPAFGDVDNDGDLDLLIGNRGSITRIAEPASLAYYENIGGPSNPRFQFRTSDYLSISSLGLSYLKPKLQDLNRDGLTDLIFTGLSGSTNQMFIISGESTGLDQSNLATHDAPLNELDQYDLHDINRDGNIDLLVGTSGGRLDLYYNVGANLAPDYELEEQGFLGLSVNPFRTNLSILIQETNSKIRLITYDDSGEVRMFQDINQNETSEPLIIEATQSNSRLGRTGSLTQGSLNGGASNTLLVGSIQGGVQAFSMLADDTGQPPTTDWQVSTYPNPSGGRVTIESSQTAIGRLISLSGKLLLDEISIPENGRQQVDLSHLPQGLYVLQLISETSSVTHLKIIIDE
ncbi:MAG: T9SS type A sorting domain-containing protein [Cyclobacteriaceae bacterium]